MEILDVVGALGRLEIGFGEGVMGKGREKIGVDVVEVVVEFVDGLVVFFDVEVFELAMLGHKFKKMFIRSKD